MKPVEQTIFGPPDGNCLAACIASILELTLDQVPNYHQRDWWDRLQLWFGKRNLQLIDFRVDENIAWSPAGYSILNAKSPRGDFLHSVVSQNGKVVWDPHPQREMGLGKWHSWTVFTVLNPAIRTILEKPFEPHTYIDPLLIDED